MNILVLGGTIFLGRHLVRELLARGHTVTTFNRGTHDVDSNLSITRIQGDRTNASDLARIPATGWDAVIDPGSHAPDVIEASAKHLRSAVRYAYISSVSVYHLDRPAIDEDSDIIETMDGDPLADENFGPRKAANERRVAAVFGARSLLIRPGLICGPYDPSDRFTYWPVRFARGGNVVVPGPPERSVQVIDMRDLVEFVVRAIESDVSGTFNVTSPRDAISMRDLIDACRDGLDVLPAATWIDGAFLAAHGCEGWIDLPLWVPSDSGHDGLMRVDVSKAIRAGLKYRPLHETVRDVRDWYVASGRTDLKAGLGPEKESELLDAWTAAISS